MPDKMSLEQFGQSIKAKHPEYKDMDDAALGKAVLAKYPQYADMVSTEPTPVGGDLRETPMYSHLGQDKLTQIRPVAGPGMGAGERVSNFVGDIGAGGMGLLLHPGESAEAMGHALLHPDDTAHQLYEGLNTHPGETIAPIMGQSAVMAPVGEAAGVGMRAAAPLLRSAGGVVNDAIIGTPAEGLHGATPGLEMAKRGIVGSSPSSLSRGVGEQIPGAVAEHRGIVAAAPQGTTINTGPLIAPPFQEEIGAGVDPRTGAASPAQIGVAGRTMRQLTHVADPNTGAITPMMRDPNLTPLEATDLKSNIYSRTNYDPSGRFNIANAGLKGAAHGLKTAVEEAVPESIPSGQSLHNLVQAKEILDPAARSQMGIPTSRSGLIGHAVTGLGTRAASSLYSLGDTTDTLSPMAGPSAPVLGLLQSLRNQKGQQQ